ncbi:MAG: caspase family protein [Acidobacteria bacterium]|nr:caspase family protein [Acidobacteriota bacterium]
MARILLFLTILTYQPYLPASFTSASPPLDLQLVSVGSFRLTSIQDDKPLTERQIEDLLNVPIEDEQLARQILRRGISFRLTPEKLAGLLKLGVGEKTRQALEEKDELTAYEGVSKETNPARRKNLAKEFLLKYPNSFNSEKVTAELRNAELVEFELEFQTFFSKPNSAGLEKVLALGRDLLQRNPDAVVIIQVIPRLAVATGKGVIGNFYDNLEQSREYANQALKLLENPSPPPGINPQTYDQIRASNLFLVYQSLGLYQLRQSDPDPDQATALLTKAADLAAGSKGGLSANDSITFWLRALARDMKLQKLGDDFRPLPKEQRLGRQGQTLCAEMTALIGQLTPDYLQVITLSARADSSQSPQLSQLSEQASEAIKLLTTGVRSCTGGRGSLIGTLPDEEKRVALVIGVEDYLDAQAGKFNFAAADARDLANVLIQHGSFRKEQVVLLATGEAADHQPIRNVILRQLAELPKRVPQDGLLLIYFAGHSFEQGGKSYLLAADSFTGSESILADTAISIEQLKEKILASGVGQVMLIFDAFRLAPVSESIVRQLSFDIRKNEVTAFATLLSASVDQRAHESAANKHSLFTIALLEASKGKAASKARGVTLDDLIKYLETTVPRKAGAGAEQLPQAKAEGYEKEDLVMFQSTSTVQAESRNPTPSELIRNSKTIQVRSRSVYMNKAILEAELRKVPEFQYLKLTFVEEGKEPDLVIEIKLPVLTWNWNYTVTHRTSNTILVSGKMRGLTDDSVSPNLAKALVKSLLDLRDPAQKSGSQKEN